jgi:glycolate oxidase
MSEFYAFPAVKSGVIAKRDAIIKALQNLLPGDGVITTANELKAFETDALTAYRRVPLAVCLPTTTEQVASIMTYCNAEGVPVIARGAGTSLAGGAIPQEDAVVIGLSKMNRVLDVNFPNRTMRVEAGITNLAVSDNVLDNRFFYAPDPSSQLACSIGGNIAMNSGGAHCLKYGVTTNNLLGVKMVLTTGEIVELGGEAMDAPGLDLLGLICGAEGQLGIVTEATVRILHLAEGSRPVLFGFKDIMDAGKTVSDIIAAGIIPVAMEYMDKLAIQICEDYAKAGYPLDVEALLIIEVEGSDAEMSGMLGKIIAIAEKNNVHVVKESQSANEAALIWKGRKSAFGATGRIADYICMDGTIPLSKLPEALAGIDRIVKGLNLRVANVFHAGDGNLHPLVLFNVNEEGELRKAEIAGEEILKLCVDLGGCLTGEHGVGIEKRDLMRHQFSNIDLKQQTMIKEALDPQWLLNPAKVFPLDVERFGVAV